MSAFKCLQNFVIKWWYGILMLISPLILVVIFLYSNFPLNNTIFSFFFELGGTYKAYSVDKNHLILWVTNSIYLTMLLVASIAGALAYKQLKIAEAQRNTDIAFKMFDYLYDEKFAEYKRYIYARQKDLKNKRYVMHNLDNPSMEESFNPGVHNAKNFKIRIDALLLLYNNISLLYNKKMISNKHLPKMFFKNAEIIHDICDIYIKMRRKKNEEYACHFVELIDLIKEIHN